MSLPDLGKIDSLGLLFTLLPGLLTFVVVHAMTARGQKIDPIEAVLYGLAYTLAVHGIWGLLVRAGSLVPTPDIVGLPLTALLMGLGISIVATSGWSYAVLRRLRVTGQSSWVTIWETAFREFRGGQGEYAVLHLQDGRRVMGSVRAFSPHQKDGHVCLDRVKWLDGSQAGEEHPGVHILGGNDIAVVEFIPFGRSSR